MSKENGSGEKAAWKGYVNFAPNASERATIKANLLTLEQVETFLASLVADGYKAEFYFDDYRESLVFAVYGLFGDCRNPGKKLVIPHADPRVAVSAAEFFMTQVADDGEWPDQEALNNPYDW